jgi:hypothetical protein
MTSQDHAFTKDSVIAQLYLRFLCIACAASSLTRTIELLAFRTTICWAAICTNIMTAVGSGLTAHSLSSEVLVDSLSPLIILNTLRLVWLSSSLSG